MSSPAKSESPSSEITKETKRTAGGRGGRADGGGGSRAGRGGGGSSSRGHRDRPMRELFRLPGHEGGVVRVESHPFLPFLFVSSAEYGTVRVWDLETRSLVRSLAGHSNSVWGLSLEPAGRRLASGSGDRTIRLWDLSSGSCLRTLRGHSGTITAVVWDASGSLVASGSWDQTVRVWDATSGSVRHALRGHRSKVYALAAHPTGDLLASGSADSTVRLWRWSSGGCVRTLEGHEAEVFALVASAAFLVSGSQDRSVRVWSWASGACVRVLDSFSDRFWQNSLAWRDSTLATLEAGGRVSVWDVASEDPAKWVSLGPLPSPSSLGCGIAVVEGGAVVCAGEDDDSTAAVWGV